MEEFSVEGRVVHRTRAWITLRCEYRRGTSLCISRALPVLIFLVGGFSGCGTVPDVSALIHDRLLYRNDPQFVGAHGPLTAKQAQTIIARLQEHQQTPTDILERHLAFEQSLSAVPLVLGNKVTLLRNGTATYQAMLAAIHGASDNINLEMYTFTDGPIGKMFADAFIDRQQHGVQVNLMYDSLGSMATSAGFFDRMRQNGIMVLQYRPINPFETKLPWSFSHRNHRKMLVVDGRIAFTGGINVSEDYASGPSSSKTATPPEDWRDTDIEVEGPVVAEFQRIFINEWNYQKGPPLKPGNYLPKLDQQGTQIVRVIGSVPERFSLIYVTLVSAIVNSETNVYITDAYFAPDHQMLHALEHAARRGVDVRLLLPNQTDEPMIIYAQRSHYKALLKAGVKIYEWQGKMLHAKTATSDGVWSTVGTSNLDWWSITRNNELNTIVLSHSFGDEMNLMFKNDTESAEQIELDKWKHRGLIERFRETGAGLIEPLL
jgi:cardiolipin synthase